jgi:hypothetical protein
MPSYVTPRSDGAFNVLLFCMLLLTLIDIALDAAIIGLLN